MVEMRGWDPSEYLGADPVVQSDDDEVEALARRLRTETASDEEFCRAAFEWVRDEIGHSVDVQDPRVVLSATDVLRERVGLCFAKSHLLTAILRAEGVPAGLCYQRLYDGKRFALHGLAAVFLDGRWHRLDPRGNKPGVDAQFSLDREQIAYAIDEESGEIDYPAVHVLPSPNVVGALLRADNALTLCDGGLPDHP